MTEVYRYCGNTTTNGIKIIYEDNHVISVIKPEGILSQSDISGEKDLLTIIKEDLRVRYNKKGEAYTGLVHRLDRNTGGTMIFAKTSKGASRLSAQLREKQFSKGYFAIAMGIIRKDGVLENRLLKDPITNRVSESERGKLSTLKYQVIDSKENTTLLFVTPVTGRTHQIRVQLSLYGHPLLGDTKYGYKENSNNMLALWSAIIRCKHVVEDKTLILQSIPEKNAFWSIYPEEAYLNTLNRLGDFQ